MPNLFDFSAFPLLETERLLLRQITPADCEALFAVFGDPEAMRYYDSEAVASPAELEQIVQWSTRIFEARTGLRWAITRKEGDGAVIGTCGYNVWHAPRADGTPGYHGVKAVIGYDLARAYWRQGIMTEALAAMLNWGFDRLALNRVEAEVTPGNAASAGLLRKLGFQLEGTLRQYGYWKGRYQDAWLFGLLRRDWEARS